MKPEDVTDEMCQAFTDVYLWSTDVSLEEMDRAAIAAAINAMPQTDAQAQIDALKAELQQRALEAMSLDAQNMELAAERDALRNALTEAGEELRWFLHEANIRGSEGPPRVWRLVRTIEGLLMIDAALAK